MQITKNLHDTEYDYLLSGRIDGPAAHQLEVEVLAAIRAGAPRIYINLAEATFLCSAAIRVILQYHRQLKAQGKSLLISRTSPEIDQILELTGFRDSVVEKT